MTTRNFLGLAKSLVIAGLAAGGLAGTAFGQQLAVPNLGGTPDDGMQCRSTPNAYAISLSGDKVFCKRTKTVTFALDCDPLSKFKNKVIRTSSTDKDVCVRDNFVVTSSGPLGGVEGQDYKFIIVPAVQIASTIASEDQAEAAAMGLSAGQVDTREVSHTVLINAGSGSADRGQVIVEFTTFPIPVGGPVISGGIPR